jgi:hypothetical protein
VRGVVVLSKLVLVLARRSCHVKLADRHVATLLMLLLYKNVEANTFKQSGAAETATGLCSGLQGQQRRAPPLPRASRAVESLPQVADLVASGQRRIELICTDVDGTLMNSQNQLSPVVEQAVNAAAQAGVPVRLLASFAPASAPDCVHALRARFDPFGDAQAVPRCSWAETSC